ncbi:LytR family transcriptional regulator [Erysipelothrix sp. HDW6C]|uniref:LCP family protein n=1 Tax=Erysipelothrix sp. HDW6C TaxID=2714930 RepID=UPI0014084C9A|nr:LCP family protein [Erysipelothrix sp. HDW6C]QIK70379.1 LytR family transcriptional regulator [Erysipelothrix sp. HDW6C]
MNKNSNRIGTILLSVAFVLLGYALLVMRFIPVTYRLIILLITVVVAMIVLIVTKKQIWRYTLAASIVVVALGVFFSQFMVNNISSGKEYELVEYVYLRLKDNKTVEPTDKVGFYGVRLHDGEDETSGVKPEYLDHEIIEYADALELADALYDGVIDGILTQSSFVADIAFLKPDFEMDTVVVDQFNITEQRQSIVKDVDVTNEPFLVYVSGIDVFGDVVTRSRSDMNMLLAVNPQTHEILTVSIPRDSYLPLGCEGGEMDKLTHAGLYGISCSVKTMENLIGHDINYYIRLNFTGLVDIVDALGGVDVVSHYDFTTDGGLSFKVGKNHVNGEEALIFARERSNIDYGDVSRGIHHQELIKAIFQKLISPENISKLPQMTVLLQNTVDTNLSTETLSTLIARQISGDTVWSFKENNLKGSGDMQPVHTLSSEYMYYVYWPDSESLNEIKQQITAIMTPLLEE